MKLPEAFSAELMAELARPFSRFDPRDAELVPGVTPVWHVVETFAHRERDVAAELVARRFGIFVPEEEETIVQRGRKVDRVSLMFPGYIFVFVWDVLSHRSRIEAIDGVLRLIMDVDGIPLFLTDDEINQIRAVENSKRYAPPMVNGAALRKGKKKRWRKTVKQVTEEERDNEIVCVRPWSAFQDSLMTLDSEERNQSLRKALGLS